MKNGTVNEKQLLYKKLEQFLLNTFPDAFKGQYQRVSFSHEPYHIALAEVTNCIHCEAFLILASPISGRHQLP